MVQLHYPISSRRRFDKVYNRQPQYVGLQLLSYEPCPSSELFNQLDNQEAIRQSMARVIATGLVGHTTVCQRK